MVCIALKMSSCMAWIERPISSPAFWSISANSVKGMSDFVMSTIIIIANIS